MVVLAPMRLDFGHTTQAIVCSQSESMRLFYVLSWVNLLFTFDTLLDLLRQVLFMVKAITEVKEQSIRTLTGYFQSRTWRILQCMSAWLKIGEISKYLFQVSTHQACCSVTSTNKLQPLSVSSISICLLSSVTQDAEWLQTHCNVHVRLMFAHSYHQLIQPGELIQMLLVPPMKH